MLIELAPGEVHVWYSLTAQFDRMQVDAALEVLSPDERARYGRLRFEGGRRDYAAAHALLRTSLSRYADVSPLEWTFHTLAAGKPVLHPETCRPILTFNLSHTSGLVACVIAGGPDVGIDVESVDRTVEPGVAERFFSARENDALRRLEPAARGRRFIDLWTLKESYLKATGEGVSSSLSSVVFEVDESGGVDFTPPPGIDPAAWCFKLFAPTDHHRLAVAVRLDGARAAITMRPAPDPLRARAARTERTRRRR